MLQSLFASQWSWGICHCLPVDIKIAEHNSSLEENPGDNNGALFKTWCIAIASDGAEGILGWEKNIEINNSLKNASEDNDSEYEYFKNNFNDLFHLYFAFLYIQGSHVIKVCV